MYPLQGFSARWLTLSALLANVGARVGGSLEGLGEGVSVLARRGLDLAQPAGEALGLTPIRREWFKGVGSRAVSEVIRGLHPVAGVATRVWKNRVMVGAGLLLKFGGDLTPADLMLYRRVVQGPIVGRTIAFDLTGTLMEQNRLHRGALAMLVGLWATGNRLVLYSDDERKDIVEVFNSFPLMQLVFGLTGLERFPETVTAEQVEHEKQVVDYQKRLHLVGNHLKIDGSDPWFSDVMSRGISGAHLTAFKGGKLPFPEIPGWDVLVDDKEKYGAILALLGFPQRAIVATPTGSLPGATLYQQLVDFFTALELTPEPLQATG